MQEQILKRFKKRSYLNNNDDKVVSNKHVAKLEESRNKVQDTEVYL